MSFTPACWNDGSDFYKLRLSHCYRDEMIVTFQPALRLTTVLNLALPNVEVKLWVIEFVDFYSIRSLILHSSPETKKVLPLKTSFVNYF